MSVTAVKARLLRARLQLRERLDKYFRDDSGRSETVDRMLGYKAVTEEVLWT